jgi:hypothetical protein
MTDDIVWRVLSSKNRSMAFYPGLEEGLNDILNFGISFIEYEDHVSEYIVADTKMIKRMIKEMDEFNLCADKPYIGKLWTSKVYMTDKIKNSSLFFSDRDFSDILNLHLNNIK